MMRANVGMKSKASKSCDILFTETLRNNDAVQSQYDFEGFEIMSIFGKNQNRFKPSTETR